MNLYGMIVLIVLIGVIGDILKKRGKTHRCKADKLQDEMERLIEVNQQLNSTVSSLQTRVVNLETIVTQEGYDLKSKINSL